MDATPTAAADNNVGVVKGPAASFGLAAAVAILFNTALAWVEDAYQPLNAYMTSLTGDPWRTHGFADAAVLFVLGYLFVGRVSISGTRLSVLLAAACIVGGGGLVLWFALT